MSEPKKVVPRIKLELTSYEVACIVDGVRSIFPSSKSREEQLAIVGLLSYLINEIEIQDPLLYESFNEFAKNAYGISLDEKTDLESALFPEPSKVDKTKLN